MHTILKGLVVAGKLTLSTFVNKSPRILEVIKWYFPLHTNH